MTAARWSFAALATAAFLVLFVLFVHPIGVGDDFWWHVSSGRRIWEQGALHESDPFAFPSPRETDLRQSLILNGYWLAQLAYYGTYQVGGYGGIVVANALVLTATSIFLFLGMRELGVDRFAALLFVFPLALLLYRFSDIRPQNLTFLSFVLLFFLLERGQRRLRSRESTGSLFVAPLAWMPLVTLVWANAHRGFILGWVVLGVVVLGELLTRAFRPPAALSRRGLAILCAWSAAAFLTSLANPHGFAPLASELTEIHEEEHRFIFEFNSLNTFLEVMGDGYYYYGTIVLGVLALLCMLVSWRRVRPAHALLFVGLALKAPVIRFSILFDLFAAMCAAGYLPLRSARDPGRRTRLVLALSSLAFAAFLYARNHHRFPRYVREPLAGPYPEAAIRLLEEERFPPRLFNSDVWGGYLTWRLHPKYRVFIDTRFLDLDLLRRYIAAREGRARGLLDAHGINTVLEMPRVWQTRRKNPLVVRLAADPEWTVVHTDPLSVIFVRR